MKSGFALALAIQLIFTFVGAVLVEDAFVKDWVVTNYGDLIKCSILGLNSVLCLSDSQKLYKIDARDADIKYFIDLGKFGDDEFVLSQSTIVTYSQGSSSIHVWEKGTGILVDQFNFDSQIKTVESIIGEVCISLVDGSVTVINWNASGELLINKDNGIIQSNEELFKAFQTQKFSDNTNSDSLLENYLYNMIDKKIVHAGSSMYYAMVSAADIAVYNTSNTQEDISSVSSFLVPFHGTFLDIGFFNTDVAVLTAEESQFIIEVYKPGKGIISKFSLPKSQQTLSGKAILVDKPLSLSTIDKVHHLVEETQSKSILFRWILRVKTHLSQLGRFAFGIMFNNHFMIDLHEISEDQYGFQKTLVSFIPLKNEVIARESSDGALLWSRNVVLDGKFLDFISVESEVVVISSHSVTSIDLRTGEITRFQSFAETIEAAFMIWSEDLAEDEEEMKWLPVLTLKFGDVLKPWSSTKLLAQSQYILDKNDGAIQSYKLVGEKLIPTWSFAAPNERIISVNKNSDDITSAIGITRSDRSVLYKYLNPNLVTVVSAQGLTLKVTVLDGITGAVLHIQEHKEEIIDLDSVNVLQSDNWIVYTYQVNYPTVEQRIVVLDLFADSASALGGEKSVLDGSYNSTISSISTKSFIFLEKILALKSTSTKFGITIRSVIALTESGSLVEVPKFVLNSRRIDDRKMTQEDLEDDFRLIPYDPVVKINTLQVLNHKRKLQLSHSPQQILVRPTGLESSAVVCFVNDLNEFCSIVQPSSSYDILSGSFDKTKLLITIATLLGAFLVSKPFVYSKKLNAQWID